MKTLKQHFLEVDRKVLTEKVDEFFGSLDDIDKNYFYRPKLVENFYNDISNFETEDGLYYIVLQPISMSEGEIDVMLLDASTSFLTPFDLIPREKVLGALCADELPNDILALILSQITFHGVTKKDSDRFISDMQETIDLVKQGYMKGIEIDIDNIHNISEEQILEFMENLKNAREEALFKRSMNSETP